MPPPITLEPLPIGDLAEELSSPSISRPPEPTPVPPAEGPAPVREEPPDDKEAMEAYLAARIKPLVRVFNDMLLLMHDEIAAEIGIDSTQKRFADRLEATSVDHSELLAGLTQMVLIQVYVAERMNELTRTQSGHLAYHQR